MNNITELTAPEKEKCETNLASILVDNNNLI